MSYEEQNPRCENKRAPKILCTYPDYETHAIVAEDPLYLYEKLIIPLSLKLVTIYLPVREPSTEEYENGSIPHIIITGEEPVWEPSEDSFAVQ